MEPVRESICILSLVALAGRKFKGYHRIKSKIRLNTHIKKMIVYTFILFCGIITNIIQTFRCMLCTARNAKNVANALPLLHKGTK